MFSQQKPIKTGSMLCNTVYCKIMYKNPPRSRKVQAPGATKIVGKKKKKKKIVDEIGE